MFAIDGPWWGALAIEEAKWLEYLSPRGRPVRDRPRRLERRLERLVRHAVRRGFTPEEIERLIRAAARG